MGLGEFFSSLTKSRAPVNKTKESLHKAPKTASSLSNCPRTEKTLKPFGTVTNIFETVNNTCVLLIYCPQHNKVAVDRSNEAIWLPFCTLSPNMSYYKAAIEAFAVVLASNNDKMYRQIRATPPYDYMQLLDLFRLQMTETNKFITRVTYYFRLKPPTPSPATSPSSSSKIAMEKSVSYKKAKFHCCQNSDRLAWLDLNYVCDGVIKNLWGMELVDLARVVKASMPASSSEGHKPLMQKLTEFGIERVFELLPRDSSNVNMNLEQSLLKKMNVDAKDIGRLFNDFLNQIYPSFYMTIDAYNAYIRFYQFETNIERIRRFFNASNYNNNGFLTFHEFLLGLIAMERGTPHNEFRIKFVFRYYDTKCSGTLCEEDIRCMVKDMMIENNSGSSPIKLDKKALNVKVQQAMKKFAASQTKDGLVVTYSKFLKAIGNLSFRGTSGLCRSKRNILSVVSHQMAAREMSKFVHINLKENISAIIKDRSYKDVCMSCKSHQYQLSQYVTYLDCATGNVLPQANKIVVERAFSALDYKSLKPISPTDEPCLILKDLPSNILMEAIRAFEAKKFTSPGEGVFSDNVATLYKLIEALFARLEPVLAKEKRCRAVDGPSYIIGDIHGNIEDLLSLEKTIWRRFPYTNVNYVFLGDYVDRGKWSLECSLYILSMKLLMPETVTVLRGNHEVRDLQIKYTFHRECLSKYGEQDGETIWELVNKIFDRLPFAATVDQSIYCAHGGIPHEVTAIDAINKSIPLVVVNPETESNVSWEIIWSDPIGPEEYSKVAEIEDIKNQRNEGVKEGYLRNNRRGTAFFYNELATSKFLNENHLTHVVRAHEVPKEGYVFFFDKKCTTIFSCSHYCGNDNHCAVILANNETLRIIRIDTAANKSATD